VFFNSGLFWFLLGAVTIVVLIGFNYFKSDRGWSMNGWKWVLVLGWFLIFYSSFYVLGTLIGENESDAGWKLFLLGMFLSATTGVGLWRILSRSSGVHSEPAEPDSGNRDSQVAE